MKSINLTFLGVVIAGVLLIFLVFYAANGSLTPITKTITITDKSSLGSDKPIVLDTDGILYYVFDPQIFSKLKVGGTYTAVINMGIYPLQNYNKIIEVK
jgi:hypothetical protein